LRYVIHATLLKLDLHILAPNILENHKQKISHLKALYHLACADNDFSKVEATYIAVVAERMGINLNELKDFDGKEPALELPDKEYKIYALFHRLAAIIMLDEDIDDKEKRYCFNLGIKMGLHPNSISEIIEYISIHGPMNTTPQDIINIFKKYSN
jgi:hypothetical protein